MSPKPTSPRPCGAGCSMPGGRAGSCARRAPDPIIRFTRAFRKAPISRRWFCRSTNQARGGKPMIVLVTGATAGFGTAIARRFAQDQARIVAVGRRRERLEALAGELGKDRVLPLPLDVRDRSAVLGAIEG